MCFIIIRAVGAQVGWRSKEQNSQHHPRRSVKAVTEMEATWLMYGLRCDGVDSGSTPGSREDSGPLQLRARSRLAEVRHEVVEKVAKSFRISSCFREVYTTF
jgi:hypothetical protein